MPDFGSATFSQTDASNATGTMPSWSGAAAPSTLDDAGRALQGAVTREWNWRSYTLTAGGTADAKTLTYSVAPAAYYNGQRFAFIANTTNTTTATLNVNSLGAKSIRKMIAGTATVLAAGDMAAGAYVEVAYNTAGDYFVWLNRGLSSFPAGSASAPSIIPDGDTNTGFWFPADDTIAASTGGSERLRVDSSGFVGVGTTSPGSNPGLLSIQRAQTASAANLTSLVDSTSGSVLTTQAFNDGVAGTGFRHLYNGAFWSVGTGTPGAATERFRIDSSGHVSVGTTTNVAEGTNTVAGATIYATGVVGVSSAADRALFVKRTTSDGTLVNFVRDTTIQGSISVAGTTTSYNAFSGSHWSQLSDGSKPDILRGTVVESIDEKCVWPEAENDQLAKFKVSDTAASKRVYGVFMAWDNDDTETNDAYITGLGAYLIRIAAGVVVSGGDLLESDGNGCARVQSDDLIKSSTIGKITSTAVTEVYPDGSYLVPCVLYCG